MQLTIQAKKGIYLDFEVETKTNLDHGTSYAPATEETIVTACYFISEAQKYESDVNVWEWLPNEIQSQIEREIN